MVSKHDPPRVAPTTPIGADVDLDRDEVLLSDGSRLTRELAEQLTEEIRRGGRPSLSGKRQTSPQIAFRVSPEIRDKAADMAARQHKTLSQLAREALEELIRAS